MSLLPLLDPWYISAALLTGARLCVCVGRGGEVWVNGRAAHLPLQTALPPALECCCAVEGRPDAPGALSARPGQQPRQAEELLQGHLLAVQQRPCQPHPPASLLCPPLQVFLCCRCRRWRRGRAAASAARGAGWPCNACALASWPRLPRWARWASPPRLTSAAPPSWRTAPASPLGAGSACLRGPRRTGVAWRRRAAASRCCCAAPRCAHAAALPGRRRGPACCTWPACMPSHGEHA